MRIQVEKDMFGKIQTRLILSMKCYSLVKNLCDHGLIVDAIREVHSLITNSIYPHPKVELKDIEKAVKHLAGIIKESDIMILESQELAVTNVMLKVNKLNILVEYNGAVHIDFIQLNIDTLKQIIHIYESNFNTPS